MTYVSLKSNSFALEWERFESEEKHCATRDGALFVELAKDKLSSTFHCQGHEETLGPPAPCICYI